MKKTIAYLFVFLFVFSLNAYAWNPMVVSKGSPVSCTSASNDSNIKFFWRIEQTDGDFSATNGTSDYSAGPDEPTLNNTPIGAGGAKLGSYGLDADSGSHYALFEDETGQDLDNIVLNSSKWDFRFGFWFRFVTWAQFGTLAKVQNSAVSYEVSIFMDSTSGKLVGLWKVNSVTQTFVYTDTAMSSNTWYWIEVSIDDTGNDLSIYVYNDDAGMTLKASGSETDSDYAAGASDDFYVGHTGGASSDFHLDHFIISYDKDDDLREYANDTAYDTCVAD